MKKFLLFFLLFPILLCSQVFQLDYGKSFTYLGGTLALDLFNNYYDINNTFPLRESEIATLTKSDVPWFDRIAVRNIDLKAKKHSDYAVYLTIASALTVSFDKEHYRTNWLVFSEILLTQSMIAKWTKSFSKRKRPFVFEDTVPLAKKQERNSQHSFYSMHSSSAFSAATFAYFYHSKKHGKNIQIALWLYGGATATAVLRVSAANHFPSDVIIGAVVGTGISYLICRYHYSKSQPKLTKRF
jgi:hypothetical protein